MPSRFSPGREALLNENVRRLTLRIAAPSLAAMLATGLCTLLDALLLARHAPQVSAAVGVCFPLLTAQQAVGFTLCLLMSVVFALLLSKKPGKAR